MSTTAQGLTTKELLDVFSLSQNATAIYTSEDIFIEAATDSMIAFWGKDRSVIGKPMEEAIPELKGQPFVNILRDVWRAGVSYESKAARAELLVNGAMQTFYFDFVYRAIRNEDGTTYCILHTATDVTERVAAQEFARKKEEQEQALAEELKSANEELTAMNAQLQDTVASLSESREQLQLAVESAELGFWNLDPQTNKIQASPRLKELFGFYPGEEMLFDIAMDNIGDGYREPVEAAFTATITQGKPYDIEFPVTGYHDGKLRWLRSTGKLYKNERYPSGNFYGTAADITERKQDEQRKNDFIGMVSHEMKTPLTSLNGYLQLLQMKSGSEDVFSNNMLGKATKQVSRMTSLINGFLNISRLESGKIQINRQRFDMAVLVKESEEEALSIHSTHRIVFHPVEETFVNADHDKIGQVISNLISNAVKYSPSNTLVNVACITRDGMAIVSVKDEGIGIKEEDQPKLFDRYYRVNHDSLNNPSGFGIGLYLCAEIIRRHDGNIWVESEVGKGSTFSFSLPVVA